MSEYPEELDTEDISELASYIERRYPAEDLLMHDSRTIHFAYWDVSHRSVCTEFLDHIQQAGYRILYAGVATCPRTATRRAWVECQKRALTESEPEATDSEVTDSETTIQNVVENEDSDQDKSDVYRISCENCDEKYLPDEAEVTIRGPGDVRYTCPVCGHGTDGPSPLINED